MAQAPVESSMSSYPESSTATTAIVSRNDDQMSVALRTEGSFNLDDIIRLNRVAQPLHETQTTAGTPTTAVFSSRKQSSGTKPTSGCTSYPIHEGRGIATYASSVAATNGSGSEMETEQAAVLVGIGDWTRDSLATAHPLGSGSARARKRTRVHRTIRLKKPLVVIDQSSRYASSGDDEQSVTNPALLRGNREYPHLPPPRSEGVRCRLEQVEEGRVAHAPETTKAARQPVTGARCYVVLILVLLIVLTFVLSAIGTHYTGKGHLAHTKVIIYSATVAVSIFTVLAMIVARQALQVALLAGLLEFVVGYGLVEISDSMWHP